LKILFISSWFPNKLEPTNGNFVQRHAEAVATLHDVEILHTIGDYNQKKTYVFDDKIINGIRTLIIYYKNSKNPVQNFLRRMKAYKMGFARMQKPNLIHANVLHNNMLFAVYLKKKYKIPFVVSEHWTSLQQENLGKTSVNIKRIAKYIAKHADYILPVSENLKESLHTLGIKTPMKVISNVVNTAVFDIKITEKKQTTKFLHVSSLIPRKRPDKIIETVHKLKENEISYSEVAEKMQASDCFILFSDNETQGCVILESYACGKPVIATAVGGVPEFIKPGLGVLIEKANEQELYSSMKDFIDNKTKFEEPEMLRKFVVDRFSKESIAEQFAKIYEEVV